MSQYRIYLEAPDYLAQWMKHDLWNETTGRVEFERGSAPHTVLATFLRRTPADYDPGDVSALVPVEVPTFKGVNPDSHNYLPRRGRVALLGACKRMFKRLLEKDLSALARADVQISDIVYAFMEKHGIDDTPKNWETIRQMYKRLRDRDTATVEVNQC